MSPTACYDDSLVSKRAVAVSPAKSYSLPVVPRLPILRLSPPLCVCSMMVILGIPQSTDNHWWKWIPGSKPRPGLAVVWRTDGDWYELGFLSSSRTLGEALVSHSIDHTRLSLVCGLLEFDWCLLELISEGLDWTLLYGANRYWFTILENSGFNMEYPKTLRVLVETNSRYLCKGYLDSSFKFHIGAWI